MGTVGFTVYKSVAILVGSNHMYVFINPTNTKTSDASLPAEITWEFAQKEIAQAKGFAVGSSGMSKGGLCVFVLCVYLCVWVGDTRPPHYRCPCMWKINNMRMKRLCMPGVCQNIHFKS